MRRRSAISLTGRSPSLWSAKQAMLRDAGSRARAFRRRQQRPVGGVEAVDGGEHHVRQQRVPAQQRRPRRARRLARQTRAINRVGAAHARQAPCRMSAGRPRPSAHSRRAPLCALRRQAPTDTPPWQQGRCIGMRPHLQAGRTGLHRIRRATCTWASASTQRPPRHAAAGRLSRSRERGVPGRPAGSRRTWAPWRPPLPSGRPSAPSRCSRGSLRRSPGEGRVVSSAAGARSMAA